MENDSKTEAPSYVDPRIEWTDDCQGKKDYDGHLLSVSTRYWPPSYDIQERHSAASSLIWGDPATDYVVLATHGFSAGSLDEVKAQVESWVAEQSRVMFDRLVGRGVEWTAR